MEGENEVKGLKASWCSMCQWGPSHLVLDQIEGIGAMLSWLYEKLYCSGI